MVVGMAFFDDLVRVEEDVLAGGTTSLGPVMVLVRNFREKEGGRSATCSSIERAIAIDHR